LILLLSGIILSQVAFAVAQQRDQLPNPYLPMASEILLPGVGFLMLQEYSEAAFWITAKAGGLYAAYATYIVWRSSVDRFAASENMADANERKLERDRAFLHFSFAVMGEIALYSISMLRLQKILEAQREKFLPVFRVALQLPEKGVDPFPAVIWYWQISL